MLRGSVCYYIKTPNPTKFIKARSASLCQFQDEYVIHLKDPERYTYSTFCIRLVLFVFARSVLDAFSKQGFRKLPQTKLNINQAAVSRAPDGQLTLHTSNLAKQTLLPKQSKHVQWFLPICALTASMHTLWGLFLYCTSCQGLTSR